MAEVNTSADIIAKLKLLDSYDVGKTKSSVKNYNEMSLDKLTEEITLRCKKLETKYKEEKEQRIINWITALTNAPPNFLSSSTPWVDHYPLVIKTQFSDRLEQLCLKHPDKAEILDEARQICDLPQLFRWITKVDSDNSILHLDSKTMNTIRDYK